MSYLPIIPATGYAGWKLLERTVDVQKAAFVQSAEVQRDEAYFRENIGKISTAEDLVSNRRLLSVALAAFGLADDIDNRYFIRNVLDEGTLDPDSLANKLADKTYLKLSEAFGFGDYDTPRTVLSDFADEILAKYEARQFEVAVGENDSNLRLAMAAQRELPELAAKESSETTKWYSIIASKSLASAMQSALGLPDAVASLDVDQQVEVYRHKAEAVFGSSDLQQFADKDRVESLIKLFLLKSQASAVEPISGRSIALQLLQGASQGAANGLSLSLQL